jgi:hypothetical protein
LSHFRERYVMLKFIRSMGLVAASIIFLHMTAMAQEGRPSPSPSPEPGEAVPPTYLSPNTNDTSGREYPDTIFESSDARTCWNETVRVHYHRTETPQNDLDELFDNFYALCSPHVPQTKANWEKMCRRIADTCSCTLAGCTLAAAKLGPEGVAFAAPIAAGILGCAMVVAACNEAGPDN